MKLSGNYFLAGSFQTRSEKKSAHRRLITTGFQQVVFKSTRNLNLIRRNKLMKRIVTNIALALVLVFSLSSSVLADDDGQTLQPDSQPLIKRSTPRNLR